MHGMRIAAIAINSACPSSTQGAGAGNAQGHQAAQHDQRGQRVQRSVGRAGLVLDETDQVRAEEPGHLPHRVDDRQAGNGGTGTQQRRRHRPEHRQAGEGAHGGNGQAEDGDGRVGGEVDRDQQAQGAHQHRHHQVPAALVAQVCRAAAEDHEHTRQQIRNGAEPADQQRVVEAHALDDRRQPEVDRVHAALDAEVDEAEGPDQRVGQHGQHAITTGGGFAGGVGLEVGLDQLAFGWAQPRGFLVTITEHAKGKECVPDRQSWHRA